MSIESVNEAISIETTLKSIYKCDKFGFGGNIDSNSIEGSPVQAYILGLAPIYVKANDVKRKNIDTFLENSYQYAGKSISEIGVAEVQKITKVFQKLLK